MYDELFFLVLNIFLIISLFFIFLFSITLKWIKNYYAHIENKMENFLEKEWSFCPIFSVKYKQKKIMQFIWFFYIFYFTLLTILFIFFYQISILWVWTCYFAAIVVIGVISFYITYWFLLTYWVKEFKLKLDNKKITDFNFFYKEKVDYFFSIYNSNETQNLINEINFGFPKNTFKKISKEFKYDLKNANINNNEEIYFLIVYHMITFQEIFSRCEYKTKNGYYFEKENLLKYCFICLRG